MDNEFEFEGLNVLDLFSGTGSISYEFASRGVGHVWSVEMNQQYSSFIKDQSKKLGLKNLTAVHHNVFDFIPICKEKFDIVFADPPYALEGLETIPDKVLNAGLVYPDRYLILEHGDEHSFVDHPAFVKENITAEYTSVSSSRLRLKNKIKETIHMDSLFYFICYYLLFYAHHSLSDRVQFSIYAVSTAGKNTRSGSSYEHTCLTYAWSKLGVSLPEYICRLDVREYEAIRITGNRAGKFLDLNRLLIDSHIQSQRTVSDTALNLSAVSHLGKSSSLHTCRH